ncbi:cupin domain-containing protein [Candidatus Woesearchaeota archaeon]|nr:cupin domain-containing protein [Candidatus Woesearchaeota archaeon]
MRVVGLNKHDKYVEERPWGSFEQFTHNEESTVKILTIKAGGLLSYQVHKLRIELWRIIEGEGHIILNDKRIDVKPGDEFLIKPGDKHRIGSESGLKFLEISFGHFDEADEVRLEDAYGR